MEIVLIAGIIAGIAIAISLFLWFAKRIERYREWRKSEHLTRQLLRWSDSVNHIVQAKDRIGITYFFVFCSSVESREWLGEAVSRGRVTILNTQLFNPHVTSHEGVVKNQLGLMVTDRERYPPTDRQVLESLQSLCALAWVHG